MAVSLPLGEDAVNRRLLAGGASILDRVLGRSPTSGYDEVEQEAARAAPDAISESLESVARYDLRVRLRELRVPLLAVYGEQDNVVTPAAESEFNGYGTSMRRMLMSDCRHFPMLDRSSQFNRLLRDFLRADDLDSLELKDEWKRRIR
jgi:pimeloyl-ACP methyl ester carboxylesterase